MIWENRKEFALVMFNHSGEYLNHATSLNVLFKGGLKGSNNYVCRKVLKIRCLCKVLLIELSNVKHIFFF